MQVDGGELFVEAAGDGPPLLLIHGWPLDHRMFARQVGPLREALEVIVYDRRGFGRSPAPPDLGREIEDIDCILDDLGLESAHVLGMSQGGRIALRYAASRPERIRSLVLQGAVVDGLAVDEDIDDERVPVAEYARLAQSGRLDEVRRRWLAHPMMRLPEDDDDARHLVESIVNDYRGADLLAWRGDAYASPVDVIERLPHIESPVLVLTGAHETWIRRWHATAILDAVPNGREIVFADSGHLSNLTEAGAYNRAVLDFVLAADAGG